MIRRALAFTPFLTTLAFLGALAVTATGCVCEDYYCDDSGCYYCDGVGCREVDPPTRPSCNGDYECPDGTVCTTLGCTAECAVDDDCPQGTECKDGLCTNPVEEPEPKPGTCESNDDCNASGVICRDGLCVVDDTQTGCGDNESCACEAADDCDDGYVCREGACVDDDDVCQFDYECAGGRTCVDGRCTFECSDGDPCPTGQTCDDGFCREVPPSGGSCVQNDDCGTAKVCIDTRCYDGCDADSDCGDGRYCSGGTCHVDDRPQPFCTSDSQCRPGHPCINGQCRTPCKEHDDCLMFDVQFSVCLVDDGEDDGFCVTANEATSECVTSIECDGDNICQDGICH